MDKKSTSSYIVAILAATLLVSMALPASADHDDKTGKMHKDPEGKITYVNAGVIGDHVVTCPGGLTATLFPNGANSVHVIVYDPTNENAAPLVDETVPLPGGPYGPITIVDIPDQRICLGGALSITSDTNPLPIPDYWEVWAEDLIYELVEDLTNGDVDIVPALFARMTAEATKSTTTKKPATCVPPAPATRICQTNTVSETQFRVLTQFSVCGKAGVSGIDTDAFTDLIAAKGAYDSYEITKSAFTVGPILFALDCGLGGTTLAPIYNDFVHWYNNDPDNQPTGPFSDLPTNDVSTCNPGLPTGGFVCFFELPAGASSCWNTQYGQGHTLPSPLGDPPLDVIRLAAPGIIGTIGWSHENTGNLDCLEPVGDGPWIKTIRNSEGFVIQHFPVDVHFDPVDP